MTTNLNDILDEVARRLKLDEKAKDLAVLALWTQVVGPPYDVQSRAVAVTRQSRQCVLKVHVASPLLATELGFEQERLLKALNAYAPQTGVTLNAIKFNVGRC